MAYQAVAWLLELILLARFLEGMNMDKLVSESDALQQVLPVLVLPTAELQEVKVSCTQASNVASVRRHPSTQPKPPQPLTVFILWIRLKSHILLCMYHVYTEPDIIIPPTHPPNPSHPSL